MNKYDLFKIQLKEYSAFHGHLLRDGQMIMNVLCDFDKDMHRRVVKSDIDCYYSDNNIAKVLSVLKTEWEDEWYEI